MLDQRLPTEMFMHKTPARTAAAEHYRVGRICTSMGKHADSIAEYSEAIRLDPRHDKAYHSRGLARARQGDHAGAIADFSELIHRQLELAALAYTNRGMSYVALGDHDAAIADYHKAMEVDATCAAPWNALGALLRMQGRRAEAIAAYEKAIEVDATFASPWSGLGVIYQQEGDRAKAMAAFQKALGLDPSDAVPYYNIACLESLGDRPTDALEYLRQAIYRDNNLCKTARADPDFAPLLSIPDFRALVGLPPL